MARVSSAGNGNPGLATDQITTNSADGSQPTAQQPATPQPARDHAGGHADESWMHMLPDLATLGFVVVTPSRFGLHCCLRCPGIRVGRRRGRRSAAALGGHANANEAHRDQIGQAEADEEQTVQAEGCQEGQAHDQAKAQGEGENGRTSPTRSGGQGRADGSRMGQRLAVEGDEPQAPPSTRPKTNWSSSAG